MELCFLWLEKCDRGKGALFGGGVGCMMGDGDGVGGCDGDSGGAVLKIVVGAMVVVGGDN